MKKVKKRGKVATASGRIQKEDFQTYKEMILKGRLELSRDQTVDWQDVKKKLSHRK